MQEIIESYEDLRLVETIVHSNNYLKFVINEYTLKALESKAKFIMECQKNIWKPLCITYHPHVRVYDKIYYIDRN